MTPKEKEETLRLHTLLQPFYRERMGEWKVEDRFMVDGYLKYYTYDITSHITKNVIRLPLPIDPVNENRGLTGMIKHFTGIRKCTELKEPLYRVDWWTKNGPEHSVYGPTPELALLRALCRQQLGEVINVKCDGYVEKVCDGCLHGKEHDRAGIYKLCTLWRMCKIRGMNVRCLKV